MWEFKGRICDKRDTYLQGPMLGTLIKTYKFKLGMLKVREIVGPLEHTLLEKLIVGLPRTPAKGPKELIVIAHLQDAIAIFENYCWWEDSPLFATSTKNLRSTLTNN